MLKIRLRRQGSKFQPHYRVVVADARAPRDGRFVSILGFYDPRTKPATIHIDAAQIEEWVRKGAQPTEAVIRLLDKAGLAPSVIETYNRNNRNKANVVRMGERGGSAATAAPAVSTTAAATTTSPSAVEEAAPAAPEQAVMTDETTTEAAG